MSKSGKGQTRKMIPVRRHALAIVARPEPIPGTDRKVKAMIDKLHRLQQEIIELAHPETCRNILPVTTSCLSLLREDASKSQLSRVSDMLRTMKAIVAGKKNTRGR